jgi:hypothetical protein
MTATSFKGKVMFLEFKDSQPQQQNRAPILLNPVYCPTAQAAISLAVHECQWAVTEHLKTDGARIDAAERHAVTPSCILIT